MVFRVRRFCLPVWIIFLIQVTTSHAAIPYAKAPHTGIPVLQWELLHSTPRLPDHFTQGLVFEGAHLFESTGHYGSSQLFVYDAAKLEVQKQHFLSKNIFAEGLTTLNKKLYLASWKSREIFVYDFSLNLLQTLPIGGESWGLTTDGTSLIMSNGSNTLQFIDPATGKTLRTTVVTDGSDQNWKDINELEWVNGKILANVWHRNIVLVIDSNSGRITGQYDLEKLSKDISQHMPARTREQVLNGMAWNSRSKTLLVTGKDWPMWFEISLAPEE